ncbi:unnamed protein product [Enterobius vermicularis]|uniref:tRNA (uracil-O(2)-)-methyltransferase n=1 Tax=Enterobius vermicularis TaxID=51028 RepID=A0A0N4V3G9_ENTVE|nr:unnamed protein product [Enterobius vermicularis]
MFFCFYDFTGYGLDVRRRKIWSNFEEADLRELALNPEKDVITDANFLIGNHNFLNYKMCCNFFLLPCCPHNFYGIYSLKIKTKDGYSIYHSYLEFIRSLCLKLGFVVEEDRLKIPSTKRHCFFCTVPSSGLSAGTDSIINEILISAKTGPFTVRGKAIEVWQIMLKKMCYPWKFAQKHVPIFLKTISQVSAIYRCVISTLCDIANLLGPEEKKLLKSSCGGLQTFIKNQHQIFKVSFNKAVLNLVSDGIVSIRDWAKDCKSDVKKPKTRMCWFHQNHPQGCPLSAESCSFKH